MSFVSQLKAFLLGSTTYVSDLNQNFNLLAGGLDSLVAAVAAAGSPQSSAAAVKSILGPLPLRDNLTFTTTSTGITLQAISGARQFAGWMPALGAVVAPSGPTTASLIGFPAATYYATINAGGQVVVSTSNVDALVSMTWSGTALSAPAFACGEFFDKRVLTLTASYTALATDCGVLFVVNSGSATNLSLPAATDAAAAGWNAEVLNIGAGIVTVVANGNTLVPAGSAYQLAQYQTARLRSPVAGTVFFDGPSTAGGTPWDMAFYFPGVPTNNQILFEFVAIRPTSFPAGLTASRGGARTAGTGSSAFPITKNGVSIGTINFASSATTATFTFASPVTFAAGDTMTCAAPASADATLGDIYATLAATR